MPPADIIISATNSGHAVIAGREVALLYAQTAKFNHRMCPPPPVHRGVTNDGYLKIGESLSIHNAAKLTVAHVVNLKQEARKFNSKLLQRQTALETQVEQLTNALKDLKEERRSVSATLSPSASVHTDQGSSNDRPHSSGPSGRDSRDIDHTGETGGVLRLQKDGESIYVGAGGSSWALQQVRLTPILLSQ